MSGPDETMARIGEAVALAGRGEPAAARDLLAGLWTEVEAGEPLYRCALAHSMADLQDEVREELAGDLRALQAAWPPLLRWTTTVTGRMIRGGLDRWPSGSPRCEVLIVRRCGSGRWWPGSCRSW